MQTEIKIKSKIDIIKETAEFYNISNRAVTFNNNCVYLDPESGNKCAVGRCIKDDIDNIDISQCLQRASALFSLNGFDILKDEYHIEDPNFWTDLQNFHDDLCNWNSTGLSERGKIVYDYLINDYK